MLTTHHMNFDKNATEDPEISVEEKWFQGEKERKEKRASGHEDNQNSFLHVYKWKRIFH